MGEIQWSTSWVNQPFLVGGSATPLKNMKVNWDDDIPNINGTIKLMATKPPTRFTRSGERDGATKIPKLRPAVWSCGRLPPALQRPPFRGAAGVFLGQSRGVPWTKKDEEFEEKILGMFCFMFLMFLHIDSEEFDESFMACTQQMVVNEHVMGNFHIYNVYMGKYMERKLLTLQLIFSRTKRAFDGYYHISQPAKGAVIRNQCIHRKRHVPHYQRFPRMRPPLVIANLTCSLMNCILYGENNSCNYSQRGT